MGQNMGHGAESMGQRAEGMGQRAWGREQRAWGREHGAKDIEHSVLLIDCVFQRFLSLPFTLSSMPSAVNFE